MDIGLVLLGVVIGAVLTLGCVLIWFEKDADRFGRALQGMRNFERTGDPYDWTKEPTEFPMVRVKKQP